MVNPFKKKTILNECVFADGRIIVTDISKLNKKDFPHENGDMLFIGYDGKIYIDAKNEASEPVISIFRLISRYPKAELRQWQKEQKARFPYIRTANDLVKLKGNQEDFLKALSMLLAPVELKSREMQKAYY